jgi:hypothetical protein
MVVSAALEGSSGTVRVERVVTVAAEVTWRAASAVSPAIAEVGAAELILP